MQHQTQRQSADFLRCQNSQPRRRPTATCVKERPYLRVGIQDDLRAMWAKILNPAGPLQPAPAAQRPAVKHDQVIRLIPPRPRRSLELTDRGGQRLTQSHSSTARRHPRYAAWAQALSRLLCSMPRTPNTSQFKPPVCHWRPVFECSYSMARPSNARHTGANDLAAHTSPSALRSRQQRAKRLNDNISRIKPRQPMVSISELTLLVVVPGDPEAARAFTAGEAAEARTYAALHNGVCLPLPLEPGKR